MYEVQRDLDVEIKIAPRIVEWLPGRALSPDTQANPDAMRKEAKSRFGHLSDTELTLHEWIYNKQASFQPRSLFEEDPILELRDKDGRVIHIPLSDHQRTGYIRLLDVQKNGEISIRERAEDASELLRYERTRRLEIRANAADGNGKTTSKGSRTSASRARDDDDTPDPFAHIKEKLSGRSTRAHLSAMKELSARGKDGEDIVPTLIWALSNGSNDVRLLAAVRIAAHPETGRILDLLLTITNASSRQKPAVRDAARSLIARMAIREAVLGNTAQAAILLHAYIFNTRISYSPSLTATLLSGLTDSNPAVVINTLRMMAIIPRIRNSHLRNNLMLATQRHLADQNESIRDSARSALVHQSNGSDIDQLAKALSKPETPLVAKVAIINTLSRIGSRAERHLNVILVQFEDAIKRDNIPLQIAAIEAIENLAAFSSPTGDNIQKATKLLLDALRHVTLEMTDHYIATIITRAIRTLWTSRLYRRVYVIITAALSNEGYHTRRQFIVAPRNPSVYGQRLFTLWQQLHSPDMAVRVPGVLTAIDDGQPTALARLHEDKHKPINAAQLRSIIEQGLFAQYWATLTPDEHIKTIKRIVDRNDVELFYNALSQLLESVRSEILQQLDAGEDPAVVALWLEDKSTTFNAWATASMSIRYRQNDPNNFYLIHDLNHDLTTFTFTLPFDLARNDVASVRDTLNTNLSHSNGVLRMLHSKLKGRAIIHFNGHYTITNHAKAKRLATVFENLARNAAMHPTAGKSLSTINVTIQGDIITIQDDGAGMPSSTLNAIRSGQRVSEDERIEESDTSTTRGRGWASIRQNLTSLGITWTINSTPGHGTTVILTLPDGLLVTPS